eukprot:318384_1
MANEYDCGSDETGGHFDPYETENMCTDNESYYDCEVGDLSGRFGMVTASKTGKLRAKGVVADKCSGASLNPESVHQRSIVFHCSTGERLFCAKFELDYECAIDY